MIKGIRVKHQSVIIQGYNIIKKNYSKYLQLRDKRSSVDLCLSQGDSIMPA